MSTPNLLKLFLLAMIWSSSFLFMRMVVPVLGPFPTTFCRVLLGGVVLWIYVAMRGEKLRFREHGWDYFFIGAIGTGIPFCLYAYASLHIPASISVILNSSAPLFGALLAWVFLGEKWTRIKLLGLLVGWGGVMLVAWKGSPHFSHEGWLGVGACLCAAFFYACSGTYLKKRGGKLAPFALSAASQLSAAVLLMPIAFYTGSIPEQISASWLVPLLVLSLVCSALAYVLYYGLVKSVGPAKALMVTFLMPVFGMIWGAVFLGETISVAMVVGACLVVGAIFLLSRQKAN